MSTIAKAGKTARRLAMNYAEFEGVQNIIDHVRFMRSYFNEVVDEDPQTRKFLPELHCAYMDRLNLLFAPHAFDLALAVVAWEDRAASLTERLRRLRFAVKGTRVNAPTGGRRKAKQ